MLRIVLIILSAVMLSFNVQSSEEKIEASKAPFYVGKTVMACGQVAQVSKNNKANYLNFDKKYPNQVLMALIWENKLQGVEKRFGNIKNLEGRRVCVRGKITEYKNKLQIQVSNPQYIRLMK
ncbi:hypothetical protein BCU68_08690 [Vibrio sp. 10N.286.49.B3]|uniref:hypothetical protein n=1 Tax=Vibrio sp. 10N.286.49.B3 TaxID=1880855 RepID=UPI000CC58717|nr:hypothetical protein [Vibrio sp. 10N.286.49.B3]PMH46201.1 hypothetical protein BCU68_08690 [Vibrio sp. 10N.286.49.B3]